MQVSHSNGPGRFIAIGLPVDFESTCAALSIDRQSTTLTQTINRSRIRHATLPELFKDAWSRGQPMQQAADRNAA